MVSLGEIRSLLRYRRVFRNYPVVIYKLLKHQFPIVAKTKTGISYVFSNSALIWLISQSIDDGGNWMFEGDALIINYKNKRLVLSGVYDQRNPKIVNGDPVHIFLKEDYAFLKNGGEICIDVGANIGDSSIWLALNGFSRVIALEPYPQNFSKLLDNVKRNGFDSSIECMNVGLSSKIKVITIDNNSIVSGEFDIHETKEGAKVLMTTLDEIISDLPSSRLCLKMDCEGCEYETILNADPKTLKRFSKIMIEYHYGYLNLKEKLEECGFIVKYTEPRRHLNRDATKKEMNTGYIFASR